LIKAGYRASNCQNYVEQILWHSDRHANCAYMVETLRHLALRGYYDCDSARVLQLLAPGLGRQFTRNARLNGRVLPAELAPHPQHMYKLNKPTVAGPVNQKNIKCPTIQEAQHHFEIPDLPKLFHDFMCDQWATSELVDRILPEDWTTKLRIRVYNSVAYTYQPFQTPTELDRILLRSQKSGQNKGRTHTVWVDKGEEEGPATTFGTRVPAIPLLYFTWEPPKNLWSLCDESERAKIEWEMDTKKRRKVPKILELMMVYETKYANPNITKPDRWTGFTAVIANPKDKQRRYIAWIESIQGPAHLVIEDETVKDPNNQRWLVNSHIDLATYWTIY
jgi:hypothetical protein